MNVVNTRKHPSQFTDEELLGMLRRERASVTRQLVDAKKAMRTAARLVELLERRLEDIEASESFLAAR